MKNKIHAVIAEFEEHTKEGLDKDNYLSFALREMHWALNTLLQAYEFLKEVDQCGADDSSLRAKIREWIEEIEK